MTYKAELIGAIYSVERNNDARLSGLIIEHYLLQNLKTKLANYEYSDVQTGWIIKKSGLSYSNEDSSPIEDPARGEEWYRLMSLGDKISVIDQAVINTFSQVGRSFFSVEYSPTPFNISSKAIKLTVNEIHPDGKKLPSESTAEILQKNLDTYLKRKTLNTRSGSLSKWFDKLKDNELESIFIQRCIMNSMKNCVDIDAIALCTKSKKLTFFELKRKYPVFGLRKFTKNLSITFSNISKIILDTTPKINTYNDSLPIVLTSKGRIQRLGARLNHLFPHSQVKNYTKVENVFYCGLDWSHYQILNICDNFNVTYKYLVWNFDPYGIVKSNKKSSNYETEILDYLLTPGTFKPKQHSFLHATLSCSKSLGLTFTVGSDSGAFSKDVRIQTVFSLAERKVTRYSSTDCKTIKGLSL